MKRLFIGGVAHGRALNFPENLRVVQVPEDMFDPVEPAISVRDFTTRPIELQLYELRYYYFGPHERAVFVRTTLSNDEVISKYSELIFSQ